jgi:hypothetical protein
MPTKNHHNIEVLADVVSRQKIKQNETIVAVATQWSSKLA